MNMCDVNVYLFHIIFVPLDNLWYTTPFLHDSNIFATPT